MTKTNNTQKNKQIDINPYNNLPYDDSYVNNGFECPHFKYISILNIEKLIGKSESKELKPDKICVDCGKDILDLNLIFIPKIKNIKDKICDTVIDNKNKKKEKEFNKNKTSVDKYVKLDKKIKTKKWWQFWK